MGIINLINSHGEIISRNGTDVMVSIQDIKECGFTLATAGWKEPLALNTCEFFIAEDVSDTDVYQIHGKEYRLYQSDAVWRAGVLEYVEVQAFEYDFVNEIKLYKQSMQTRGVNLPGVEAPEYEILNARVRSVKANTYIQNAFHTDKMPTHLFTLWYPEIVNEIAITDRIVMSDDRSFEILSIENLNEQNKILALNCIEVLDVI